MKTAARFNLLGTNKKARFSFIELKTLDRLQRYSGTLRCRGSYWALDKEPSFAIAFETVRRLADCGFLRPVYRQQAKRGDWKLTPEGEAAALRLRGEYLRHVQKWIDDDIRGAMENERIEQEKRFRLDLFLADHKGVWVGGRSKSR